MTDTSVNTPASLVRFVAFLKKHWQWVLGSVIIGGGLVIFKAGDSYRSAVADFDQAKTHIAELKAASIQRDAKIDAQFRSIDDKFSKILIQLSFVCSQPAIKGAKCSPEALISTVQTVATFRATDYQRAVATISGATPEVAPSLQYATKTLGSFPANQQAVSDSGAIAATLGWTSAAQAKWTVQDNTLRARFVNGEVSFFAKPGTGTKTLLQTAQELNALSSAIKTSGGAE